MDKRKSIDLTRDAVQNPMERVNQWLSLIANIGVIAGIAFLAYELRQNTNAMQSQTRATIFAGGQEELWKSMEYPDVTVNTGVRNEKLTTEEKIRLDAWLTASMRAREFAWLEIESGNLPANQWAIEKEIIRTILGTSRTRRWWSEIARPAFPSRFAAAVDEVLENSTGNDYVEKVLSIE